MVTCGVKKSLEAILCFHQGFLIKYSSTLSRLSILTVSSSWLNYNIWSALTTQGNTLRPRQLIAEFTKLYKRFNSQSL